ncbi:hypothetical protein DE146DRAFT_97265 [Phaeosphaeria sp. MPI-PUGE-AT-0046c]|nr:hypothetical protein DE146DRAFT_97265 [Phaeosphaeria sp. MPI-PUGE-AT-0046c]
MVFKNLIMRVRRTLLCCNQHKRKASLDISEPTNVRKVDVSDALPGLTDAQRRYIREKVVVSSDGIHLLGLQSQPITSPPSPTGSDSPLGSHSPSLAPMSREPSEPLLNAASKDLPSALPTPPRRAHHESSPPAVRMKGMHEKPESYQESDTDTNTNPNTKPARRLSFSTSLSNSSSLTSMSASALLPHDKEPTSDDAANPARLTPSFMTLNFDFDWEAGNSKKVNNPEACDEVMTPRTVSLSEGFEPADTVGGHAAPVVLTGNEVVKKAMMNVANGDSYSDSEEDVEDGEKRLLAEKI